MSEITAFANLLLPITAGYIVAILGTKISDRLPVPAPVLFLVAAAFLSDFLPQLRDFFSIKGVERTAVVALIVILLNGGMDLGLSRLRASLAPVLSIGILGTFLTAALVALAAHFALGFDWVLAGVVGAALAPTDPAVVFAVLGRREISGRAGTTLEGEAGVNDPAGIALMLGMVELATEPDASFLVVITTFVEEMAIGLACGAVGAWVLLQLVRRLQLDSEGLYPVLVLALAGAIYDLTSLAHGSGFLAVFVVGLALGDAATPYKAEIERFQQSLASVAEIVVFVALGLTISITDIPAEVWLDGAVLALVLALVARPLTVAATLSGLGLKRNERLFVAWSGLKGAVPILLAAFALLGGVDQAPRIYEIVFVVVLLSVLVQGSLVPAVAQGLGLPMHRTPPQPWQLVAPLAERPENAFDALVQDGSSVDGQRVSDLQEATGAWTSVVVREGRALLVAPELRLQAGDRLHLLAEPDVHGDIHRRVAAPRLD